MSSQKLTDRIARVETLIDDLVKTVETSVKNKVEEILHDILPEKKIITDNETIHTIDTMTIPEYSMNTPIHPPPIDNNNNNNLVDISIPSSTEEITPVKSNTLMSLLSSVTKSSYTETEKKLLHLYKNYVDNFLETHILNTKDKINMDYRIILITLEFISSAEKDICTLGGITELDIDIATNCVLWLISFYKKETNTTRLDLPSNIELLIKSYYDLRAKKYTIDPVKDINPEEKERKKKMSFLVKSKVRLATIRSRFNNRTDSSCLP